MKLLVVIPIEISSINFLLTLKLGFYWKHEMIAVFLSGAESVPIHFVTTVEDTTCYWCTKVEACDV